LQSIEYKILMTVRGTGRGSVFSPNHFLGLGSRRAVDLALHRLVRKGMIRRLARGLYDFPKIHEELGVLAPSAQAIARALAGKAAVRLQPSGAYAANLLGLTDQVPAKVLFLTDGASKTVRVGGQEIQLKRTTPRNMATAGRISGLVIHALRDLGPSHIDGRVIEKLRHRLSAEEKARLLRDLRYAPAWIGPHLRAIAEAGS
jgi:hypothetical protein